MAIENLTNPGEEPVDGDLIRIDGIVTKRYHEPLPDNSTYLTITLSSYIVTVNTEITITAEVTNTTTPDGSPIDYANVSQTYYVPILGVDGIQKDLLEIDVANGYAQINYTPTSVGIYSINVGNIRPVPTSILTTAPELIVKAS